MKPARAALVSLAVLALSAAAARGGEPHVRRMVRLYDWSTGFPWSYAGAVEQDARGFLWVGTTSGLYRFDGTRALRMGDGFGIAPGGTAAKRVIVYSQAEGTFEAEPGGLKRLDSGASYRGDGPYIMAVATDGTPWRVRDRRLERLDAAGAWNAVPLPTTPDDPPRVVRPGRDGRVVAASSSKLWSLERDGSVRFSASVDSTLLAVERADGTLIVGANQPPGPITTHLFEVTAAAVRPIYEERGSRLISIAERGDKIWVATDHGLEALGPGYVAVDRLPGPELPSVGHIIVDREGSLWMATAAGLLQLPEPEVYAIGPEGGGVTRDTARTPLGIWGAFWARLGFFGPGAPRWIDGGAHYSTLCRDGAGRIWTSGPGGLTRLSSDGSPGKSFPGSWNPATCGMGASGRRWIVSGNRELWTVSPGDDRPRRVAVTIPAAMDVSFAAESGDGSLWVAIDARFCAAPAADVAAGRPVSWRCEALPEGFVISMETMPSGDLWAVTWDPNVLRRRAGGRWEAVPGPARLGVNWINAVRPSPSGGVWIAGKGLLIRVVERADLPDGWEIVERPTAWNGLISLNVNTVEEDADGTLWLGTDVGIERIPAAIRRRRPEPPAVELVSGSVNGAPIPASHSARIPYGRNRLDAHFAAMTYRDLAAVRYRMRVNGDEAWSAPSPDGHFHFVDLPAGRYELEVAASLDGEAWSAAPGRLAFQVSRPWYADPWILGVSALGLALAGHLSYRLRVRRRMARENQRTRIAMDLHDEVGSGLGAISVLAGIAARPDLPAERREDVLDRIGSVSQDLARSLGDIVWSLRTSSGYLDALWDQLVERARPLFGTGEMTLSFAAPDPVPHEALSLVVRRNLHLVVYEALHNARRHSEATSVGMRLKRDGTGWRIEVEDNGRGLPVEPAPGRTRRGLGLEAMKARAAEMGGTIAWERGRDGGTRVAVTFRTGEG